MEWIGNIDNKAQAIRDLHGALDAEGQHGFLMRFDTSNETMRCEDAVADQLDHVASQLRGGYTSGILKDANGNTIGSWETVIPAPLREARIEPNSDGFYVVPEDSPGDAHGPFDHYDEAGEFATNNDFHVIGE